MYAPTAECGGPMGLLLPSVKCIQGAYASQTVSAEYEPAAKIFISRVALAYVAKPKLDTKLAEYN